MIPSGYMASGLVRQEIFNTRANAAIATAQQQEGFFVLRKMLNHRENKVGLIVNGTGNAEKISALLVKSLNASGVKEPKVNVVYAGGNDAKIEELLASQNNSVQLQNELKEQQAYIDTVLAGKTADTAGADDAAVLKELKAQYPEAEKIVVGRGLAWDKAQTTPVSEQSESQKNAEPKTDTYDDIVVVSLELEQPLPAKDYERIQAWLRQRYEGKVVSILQTHKSQTDKPSNE
jgi:putative membrane protein